MTLNPIEDIKHRLNIVEIVGETVKLTRAGTNYKALCPFHEERTPSFMVSEDKQIWHCFGCDEGGDIFGFIQKIEGVEFPEALRILAARAGVKLARQDPKLRNQRTKLQDICRLAARYFHRVLLQSHRADGARRYVRDRGVSEAFVSEFMIGYADDAWDSLYIFLRQKGFVDRDMEQAGLIIRREKGIGFYDRFRDRVMFPLCDAYGNTVGFSGRLLREQEGVGKYINTPQTPLFDKSRVLYGLDKAKTTIRKEGFALLVEGQMDVISCHQAGFRYAVASSGTALTEVQVALLKRFCSTVKIAFDRDEAGEQAANRGIDVALRLGLAVEVVTVPFGKDPDECLRKDPASFERAVRQSQPFMDFYFDRLTGTLDLSQASDKKTAAKILLSQIALLPDPIEQVHYIQRLSQLISVPEDVLRQSLPRAVRSGRFRNQRSSQNIAPLSVDEKEMWSEKILALCLQQPRFIERVQTEQLDAFLIASHRDLYKMILSYYTQHSVQKMQQWPNVFLEQSLFRKLLLQPLASFSVEEVDPVEAFDETFLFYITQLKKRFLNDRLRYLETEIRRLEAQSPHDHHQSEILLREFSQVSTELHKL